MSTSFLRTSVAGFESSQSLLPQLDAEGAPLNPALFIELDSDDALLCAGTAEELLSSDATVLIGIWRAKSPINDQLFEACDLVLTEQPGAEAQHRALITVEDLESAIATLTTLISHSPLAAVTLAQVLRVSERLSIPEAMNSESFAYSTLLGGREFKRWLATGRKPGVSPPAEIPDPVLVTREGTTLHIELNHESRRNAYHRQLRDALSDALRIALIDPDIEQVFLSGRGPCFSAGGDLGEFGLTQDTSLAHFIRTQAGSGPLIAALGDRMTLRAHGTCIGAGAELVAFAARVQAVRDATFSLPEVQMGLIPGAGGTVSIPRRIGRWRTAWIGLSGDVINAQRALEWGLIDQISER